MTHIHGRKRCSFSPNILDWQTRHCSTAWSRRWWKLSLSTSNICSMHLSLSLSLPALKEREILTIGIHMYTGDSNAVKVSVHLDLTADGTRWKKSHGNVSVSHDDKFPFSSMLEPVHHGKRKEENVNVVVPRVRDTKVWCPCKNV